MLKTFENPYKAKFTIVDISGMDFNSDLDFIQSKIKEYDPKICFIDGLYMIAGEGKSEWEKITNVSRRTKQIALNLQKPIIATTQATRTKSETLAESDVAYTNALVQDCDLLIGVNRMFDKITEQLSNKLMLEILAARDVDKFKFFLEIAEGRVAFKEIEDEKMTSKELKSYDFGKTPF